MTTSGNKGQAIVIESSDQVPRFTILKRFPVSKNFGVTPKSRIGRGKTWPAPTGATRVKRIEIYRYTRNQVPPPSSSRMSEAITRP